MSISGAAKEIDNYVNSLEHDFEKISKRTFCRSPIYRPNTGDTDRMIVEANWGLGESVVGGEAMPDVYILNKETLEIVERKLGTKGKYVAFRDVGVIEDDTPTEKKDTFCLRDEEVKEIGRVGKILETHFGVPQDAEWAIEESLTCPDCVLFLQTRAEVIAQQKKPVEQVIDLMLNTSRS
jgi:pyruvate,water dikinase